MITLLLPCTQLCFTSLWSFAKIPYGIWSFLFFQPNRIMLHCHKTCYQLWNKFFFPSLIAQFLIDYFKKMIGEKQRNSVWENWPTRLLERSWTFSLTFCSTVISPFLTSSINLMLYVKPSTAFPWTPPLCYVCFGKERGKGESLYLLPWVNILINFQLLVVVARDVKDF